MLRCCFRLLRIYANFFSFEGGGCTTPNPFLLDDDDDAPHPHPGVDCTALKGVLDVACLGGTCQVRKCEPNWKINRRGDGCVKLNPTSFGVNMVRDELYDLVDLGGERRGSRNGKMRRGRVMDEY